VAVVAGHVDTGIVAPVQAVGVVVAEGFAVAYAIYDVVEGGSV
jgi:hypothetical protein